MNLFVNEQYKYAVVGLGVGAVGREQSLLS